MRIWLIFHVSGHYESHIGGESCLPHGVALPGSWLRPGMHDPHILNLDDGSNTLEGGRLFEGGNP